MLPFAVESCGGMAQDALRLIHAMAEEGEDTMRMWSSEQIPAGKAGSDQLRDL